MVHFWRRRIAYAQQYSCLFGFGRIDLGTDEAFSIFSFVESLNFLCPIFTNDGRITKYDRNYA